MNGSELGTTRFFDRDQERFAALSGDCNPIHMDPVAARKVLSGRVVVHGVHVVLRGLEMLALRPDRPADPRVLSVRFLHPVFLDETVTMHWTVNGNNHHIGGSVMGLKVMTMTLSPVIREASSAVVKTPRQGDVSPLKAPCDRNFHQLATLCGRVVVPAPPSDFAKLFPALAEWLGAYMMCDLAGLSTLVGMECPGLHSLFSGFHIQLERSQERESLFYEVVSTDIRNHLVRMQVRGAALVGTVDAMSRMPPTAQRSVLELTRIVSPGAFDGQVALILGGSRGLGELTAKLVAAGGGHPIITYAVGQEDAIRVQREMVAAGKLCDIVAFDVTHSIAPQVAALTIRPTHFYYFATPRIFGRKANRFDHGLFAQFSRYFCTSFAEVCRALLEVHGAELAAFYPSTVFIDSRPKGMTEYTMAKAAGEILCADLAGFHKGLRIITERLPRMPTDQTATVFATKDVDTVEIMLPVVRLMHGFVRV